MSLNEIKRKKNKQRAKLRELFDGKYNGDIFVEVRCRVYAFEKYIEFWKHKEYESQSDLLDDAYRFLYQSVDPDFIMFLAQDHNMEIFEYADMLLHQYDPQKKEETT